MTGALLHSVTHITYLRCFYSTRISNMPAPRISKDANGNLQLVLGIPQKGFSFPKTSFWLCIYQKYNVNDIIIKMFDGLKKKTVCGAAISRLCPNMGHTLIRSSSAYWNGVGGIFWWVNWIEKQGFNQPNSGFDHPVAQFSIRFVRFISCGRRGMCIARVCKYCLNMLEIRECVLKTIGVLEAFWASFEGQT